MQQIVERLKKAFPFSAERSATEADFLSFCADQGIEVIFHPEVTDGIYAFSGSRHCIFLSPRLSGWRLRYVMFHELGHYLFHVPQMSGSYGFDDRHRNHVEAEATAAYLLLPNLTGPAAQECEAMDFEAGACELRPRLFTARVNLFKTYGI